MYSVPVGARKMNPGRRCGRPEVQVQPVADGEGTAQLQGEHTLQVQVGVPHLEARGAFVQAVAAQLGQVRARKPVLAFSLNLTLSVACQASPTDPFTVVQVRSNGATGDAGGFSWRVAGC